MSSCCCGTCHKIKINNNSFNGSMFVKGFKKCRTCSVWLLAGDCVPNKIGKLFCPCCRNQVSHRPRGRHSPELKELINDKSI